MIFENDIKQGTIVWYSMDRKLFPVLALVEGVFITHGVCHVVLKLMYGNNGTILALPNAIFACELEAKIYSVLQMKKMFDKIGINDEASIPMFITECEKNNNLFRGIDPVGDYKIMSDLLVEYLEKYPSLVLKFS